MYIFYDKTIPVFYTRKQKFYIGDSIRQKRNQRYCFVTKDSLRSLAFYIFSFLLISLNNLKMDSKTTMISSLPKNMPMIAVHRITGLAL